MRHVFVDADYWVALLNPKDSLHLAAINITQNLGQVILVTTYWVLLELFNVIIIKARPLRKRVVNAFEALRKNPNVIILPATRDSFEEGVELLSKRLNRRYSLPDCISICEIKNRAITDVLSADRHFKQEGINTLLRR